eukprot:CAMPEP_0204830208 /NCGR_PEP_ID=MMETSP1346-20131115/8398_1 /ASSEMBLY_ACC=CAM_ASM_000771 /TAXON_ID=215587 /ORGANISM="Aplanochytrium stocchinoi, Strain GSBS06" /LENGTH=279 /DNA_ID=CAMNT_0051960361 /DNA_START=147 /DNA_END=986 /DNA_ORIENTATION=+
MEFQIEKVESLEKLEELKKLYVEDAIAPLDGMWLCGFVPMATHFGLYIQDEIVGYFCVNPEGYMLQFMLKPTYRARTSEMFRTVLDSGNAEIGPINGAFCSTAEPSFLSLCLDNFAQHKVNALMYQRDQFFQASNDERIALQLVKDDRLEDVVKFAHEAIGAPTEWLGGYYSNLISRGELYAHVREGQIVSTGECRGYDQYPYQIQYADIGVIVAEKERSKGLATKVLKYLKDRAEDRSLIPICSTEASNVAAQRAISHAGFYSTYRILQFDRKPIAQA